MVHVYRGGGLDQGVHFGAQDGSLWSDIVERGNRHMLAMNLVQHLLVIDKRFVYPRHYLLVVRAPWGLVRRLWTLDSVD